MLKIWIDSSVPGLALFGLPPLERLERTVAKLELAPDAVMYSSGATITWSDQGPGEDAALLGQRLRAALIRNGGPLLVIDGATAVDPRLIKFLLGRSDACVAELGEGDRRAAVLMLGPELADHIPADATRVLDVVDALLRAGVARRLGDEEMPGFVAKLRRVLPFWLFAVPDKVARGQIERWLFWSNYKGSTDFLTRWVFPALVWPMVRASARLGIHPNAITVLSIVLAFLAVPLFAGSYFTSGFIAAFAMAVLDSVDGKLARLTLTDSRIGNFLDHGLDVVHPPFWYWGWAVGLGAHAWPQPLWVAMVMLNAAYVADRLVLLVAKRRLGFGLHAATPLDTRVRTFIARRNTNMTIMAIALLLGLGLVGFYLVAAWQLLTLFWHTARTYQLAYVQGLQEPRPE